jgi:hypothetical protein
VRWNTPQCYPAFSLLTDRSLQPTSLHVRLSEAAVVDDHAILSILNLMKLGAISQLRNPRTSIGLLLCP